MSTSFLQDHPEDVFQSWPALTVNLVFIVANAIALVPSILILISVLGYHRMRTVDNLVVCQIALIDVLYAMFTIVWQSTKLITNQKVLNPTTCQIEGAVSVICKVTWLYSATVCAFWRYNNVVHRRQLSRNTMVGIQLSQWILPILCASIIGVTGKFDLMPSGGYCYLAYRQDDVLLLIYYLVNIFIIVIPTFLAIYFYYAITDQFYQIVQQISDCSSDSNQMVNQYQLEKSGSSYQKIHVNSKAHLPDQVKLASDRELEKNPSLKKYRQVAFRAVMYCSIFILSFLPYGIAMIVELVTGRPRSNYVDALVAITIMAHKILSPIVTLLINAAIFAKVKSMINLN